MRMRSSLLLIAATVFALVTVGFNTAALAASTQVYGAIFTTDQCSKFVNANLYDTAFATPGHCEPTAPYLNGGPPPNKSCTSAGLPNGDYYFQVTDPSGKNLLSNDRIGDRKVTVSGGLITTNLGTHTVGIGKCSNIAVELAPFDRTTNNGGEYKVWMTKKSDYACYDPYPQSFEDTIDCKAGGVHGFVPSKSKTDNFKVMDFDGDGIPDASDNCPDDPDPSNNCGVVVPAVAFVATGSSVLEGDVNPTEGTPTITLVNIPVSLSAASNVTVDYTVVVGGTAIAGVDFNLLGTGTLTFSAGGDTTQYIQVEVIGNVTLDFDRNIVIQLSNPIGGVLGDVTTYDLTIVNEDTPSPA